METEIVQTSQQDDAPKAPLVLVVHASVGSGHRSAANAIASALELLRDEARTAEEGNVDSQLALLDHAVQIGREELCDLRIEVLDILDFGRIAFDGDSTASMFTGVTRPYYDITWRYTFTGRLLWGGGTIWDRIMFPRFVEYVRENKPAAIVCTHITAANAAVGARMITQGTFPILCVPTDYEIEGLWPHKYTDLFCVADERMAETLRPRRVPPERIQITGIPTSPDFGAVYDQEEIRKKYGLPTDKHQVLILAGAKLPRPYIHFRAAISEMIPYMHTFKKMHMVIVAGQDEAYAREVKRALEAHQLDNVTVLGYVDEMAALMSSSDLVICKSGGLTVTECLNARTPMILLGKAYGQEKANVAMVTATGSALHVTTAGELIGLMHHISDHPEMTDAILVNASFIRRPNAAMDIAEATIRLINKKRDPIDPILRRRFASFYWGGKPAHIR